MRGDERMAKSQMSELSISRVPILIWVALVYAATIILENAVESSPLRSLLFTAVISLHAYLHWDAERMARGRPWLYFVIQGMLIFASALTMTNGFAVALLGLFPILIGQSVGIYYQKLKVTFVFLLLYGLFCLAIISVSEAQQLALLIPLLLLLVIVVVAYAVLFYQQFRARVRTQAFLHDLELAHMKVEELTIANERQRMARDLHDTLAQGVAGLIMQLEAIDSYLEKGNTGRAQQIVGQSMKQARRTLAEAREAIDNLRKGAWSELDFAEAVREEVARFTQATGVPAELMLDLRLNWSSVTVQHVLHIVSECLTNVAKHAAASQVGVTVSDQTNELLVLVKDNGRGFDPDSIGRVAGHYGLIGLRERVRLLGAELDIQSGTGAGTAIQVVKGTRRGETT